MQANLKYDPEVAPEPRLRPGTAYQATREEQGCWSLPLEDGGRISVAQRDLIKQRNKPHQKLRDSARHAFYEMAMLVRAYEQHRIRFAYTAWFVHFRNLDIFFTAKGHGEDDEVLAQDFFSDATEWHRLRRAVTAPDDEVMRRYRTAANELAVHLTYSRRKHVGDDLEPSRDLTEYFRCLAWTFLDSVSGDRREWFCDSAISDILGRRPPSL